MWVLWWYRLLDLLRIQGKRYRTTFCWLLVWLVVGAVLGIVTLVVGDVEVDGINYHLIDGNLLNATALSPSMGSFIWQRILSLMVPILIVFIGAVVSQVTAWIIFPLVLVHGYWLSVAIWWVFFYFSFPAILVIIFYTVWLLLVTAIMLAGLIWAFRCGGECRTCHGKWPWGTILRGFVLVLGIAVVFGFFEYLIFCTILGKIVYKAL